MPLLSQSVSPIVDQWELLSGENWSNQEKGELIQRILAYCSALIPHIVPDTLLTDDDEQKYLSGRVIAGLDDFAASASSSLRYAFGFDNLRFRRDEPMLALGLRSASRDEIADLPGIGTALAESIGSYLTKGGSRRVLTDLLNINGIGEERLSDISKAAYLDQPRINLVSNELLEYISKPCINLLIIVLTASGLVPVYGDQNTVERRLTPGNKNVFDRVADMLDVIVEQIQKRTFAAGGVLASEAKSWLKRTALRQSILENASSAEGEILINEAYVDATKDVIDAASLSVDVMLFLGTLAQGDEDTAAPMTLVEALEDAFDRSVDVRVILDQDDGGVPYKSAIINRPLLERLKQKGIPVKFDEKDVLLHSKFLVADNGTAVVGSHNWTRAGFNNTHEVSLLVKSGDIASAVSDRFDAVWQSLPDT